MRLEFGEGRLWQNVHEVVARGYCGVESSVSPNRCIQEGSDMLKNAS